MSKKTNKKTEDTSVFLDREEQQIEKALEKGEYESVKDLDKSKKIFEQAARDFRLLNKSKSITLRVNYLDLLRVKAKAKEKNIPYQTLLNVLIHQYVVGREELKL